MLRQLAFFYLAVQVWTAFHFHTPIRIASAQTVNAIPRNDKLTTPESLSKSDK